MYLVVCLRHCDVTSWCLKPTETWLYVEHIFTLATKQIKGRYQWTFARGIKQWLVDHPHKGPVMQNAFPKHCNDAIMSAMASQITGVSIVYSTVCSGEDQGKHRSSASLAFVRGIHRWPVNSPSPVNSPHKWPVTRKMFPFDDVIMRWRQHECNPLGKERFWCAVCWRQSNRERNSTIDRSPYSKWTRKNTENN